MSGYKALDRSCKTDSYLSMHIRVCNTSSDHSIEFCPWCIDFAPSGVLQQLFAFFVCFSSSSLVLSCRHFASVV